MISTEPLTGLPVELQLHMIAALVAVALGPVAIYRRRRDIWHKAAGYGWVIAMLTTAASSFWLHAQVLPIGFGFGPIHVLSVWVFYVLYRAVQAARRGQIARHQAQMRSLYWTGLMVAGLFTLMPYRVLNRVLFPGEPETGVWVIGAALVAIALWGLRQWRVGLAARG